MMNHYYAKWSEVRSILTSHEANVASMVRHVCFREKPFILSKEIGLIEHSVFVISFFKQDGFRCCVKLIKLKTSKLLNDRVGFWQMVN